MADETKQLMIERTSVHGEFMENSRATWGLMEVLQKERNWPLLNSGQRHALYMIAHKMARIMAGDPNHPDHWDDIAGYARCISDRVREPVEVYNPENLYAVVARGLNSTPAEAEEWVKSQARQRAASTNGSAPPDGRASAPSSGGARELPRGRPAPTAGPTGTASGTETGAIGERVSDLSDRLSRSIEEELNKGP